MPILMDEIDVRLRNSVRRLVEGGEYDSAIRKAMVHLKSRVAERFNLDVNIDGDKLVNLIFGGSSAYMPDLTAHERQAYRDLFAGMHALLRNVYMHNDVPASFVELNVVLSNANRFLKLVGDFRLCNYEILLVEDSDLIRNMMLDWLKQAGYSVRSAGNVAEARQLFLEYGDPCVLITEHVFHSRDPKKTFEDGPGTRGEDLVDFIHRFSPTMPVIYASGYGMSRRDMKPIEYEIQKPFEQKDLMPKVIDDVNHVRRTLNL